MPVSTDRVSTPLWRNHDFMVLWAGQLLSLIGGEVTYLALPLIALSTLDVSPFQIGLLSTFSTLPWLLVSLPAGVVVDRYRRRSVMMACDLGRAVILTSVPLAASLSSVSLPQLYAVAVLSGTLNVFFSSAYLSTPPGMVTKAQLTAANGLVLSATATAGLVGPSFGAFLIGAFGAPHAVVADIASFLVSIVSLLFIKQAEARPAQEPGSRAARHFTREMGEGLRIIVADRVLTVITLANSLGNFLISGLTAITLLYLIRGLHWSVHAVGIVMGIAALGGLAGSLSTGWFVKRFGMVRVLLFGQILFGPARLVVGLVGPGLAGQVVIAVGLAIGLFSVTVYNIAQRSYRMQSCPSGLLGRLNATASWLQWGLRPVAGVVGGGLATLIGIRSTILIFAALLPVCAILLWFSPLHEEYQSLRPPPVHAKSPA